MANAAFASGKTKPLEFREKQLRGLLKMYTENKTAMIAALAEDLHRSKQEAVLLEIDLMINDVKNILQNLRQWVDPEEVKKSL